MKQVVEGYLFITSGCEHGPTIMKWNGDWDKNTYKKLKDKSWCDNEFYYNSNSSELNIDFEPGKKYRLTVEEITEPEQLK